MDYKWKYKTKGNVILCCDNLFEEEGVQAICVSDAVAASFVEILNSNRAESQIMDLEKPYQDEAERDAIDLEKCRAKEAEIWVELQDECWAEKEFIYPHIADTNKMLADIFAIVAEYHKVRNVGAVRSGLNAEVRGDYFTKIFDKLDTEVTRIAEFQTKIENG